MFITSWLNSFSFFSCEALGLDLFAFIYYFTLFWAIFMEIFFFLDVFLKFFFNVEIHFYLYLVYSYYILHMEMFMHV